MATSKKFSVSLTNGEGKEIYFSFATEAEANQFASAVRSGSNQVVKTWKWNPETNKSELVELDHQPDLTIRIFWLAPDGLPGCKTLATIGEAEAAVKRAVAKGWKAYYKVGDKAFVPKPTTPALAPAPVEQKAEAPSVPVSAPTPAPVKPAVSAPAPVVPKVHLWTDGSCKGNGKATNKGGWSAILLCNGKRKEISGGEENTTNNRMELLAVIQGLKALKNKAEVVVHSDSAYFTNAIDKGWLKKWRSQNWTNSQKKPVENRDLWEEFIALSKEKCTKLSVEKVAGHSGNSLNEACDALAVAAAEALK